MAPPKLKHMSMKRLVQEYLLLYSQEPSTVNHSSVHQQGNWCVFLQWNIFINKNELTTETPATRIILENIEQKNPVTKCTSWMSIFVSSSISVKSQSSICLGRGERNTRVFSGMIQCSVSQLGWRLPGKYTYQNSLNDKLKISAFHPM